MKKALYATLIGGAAVAAMAFTVDSGLKPGENVTPFHPKHLSGPLAKTDKCFPCTFQNRPQVQVWVNGDEMGNVHSIAKTLNKAMDGNKDFKALVVFVTDGNNDALASKIEKAAATPGLGAVGMAVLDKSNEAIKAYKINLEAKNTVFVYKNWKVEQKFVDLKGDEKGLAKLNEAIKSVL